MRCDDLADLRGSRTCPSSNFQLRCVTKKGIAPNGDAISAKRSVRRSSVPAARQLVDVAPGDGPAREHARCRTSARRARARRRRGSRSPRRSRRPDRARRRRPARAARPPAARGCRARARRRPARIASSRCSHGPKRFQMLSVATRSVFIVVTTRTAGPCSASASHLRSGAKYSSIGPALAARPPPIASSASGHGLARAERQHRHELRAGRLAVVDRALVERPRVARGLAERAVELELVDAREEVAHVRRARRRRGTSRRDRSRRRCARPARATPWYFSLSAPPRRVVVGGRRSCPEKTSQRHLSMSRPNGRNATFSSAIFICWLMRACSSGRRERRPRRPRLFRYAGVTLSAIVSPMASWKPSLAPCWKRIGSLS